MTNGSARPGHPPSPARSPSQPRPVTLPARPGHLPGLICDYSKTKNNSPGWRISAQPSSAAQPGPSRLDPARTAGPGCLLPYLVYCYRSTCYRRCRQPWRGCPVYRSRPLWCTPTSHKPRRFDYIVISPYPTPSGWTVPSVICPRPAAVAHVLACLQLVPRPSVKIQCGTGPSASKLYTYLFTVFFIGIFVFLLFRF